MDASQTIPEECKSSIQQIVLTFLYYDRAVECTILPYLNSKAEQQAHPTQNTEALITRFLDYEATNPNTVVKFRASDMVLHIDIDASYLSKPRASSHTGGYYYLSSQPANPKTSPHLPPLSNGLIYTELIILRHVVASADKVEVSGLFYNVLTYVPLRITLNGIGFSQPPTPIKTDNSSSEGIVTVTVRKKSSKAIYMRFYWIKDRVKK